MARNARQGEATAITSSEVVEGTEGTDPIESVNTDSTDNTESDKAEPDEATDEVTEPQILIEDYTPEVKPNIYAGHVKALLDGGLDDKGATLKAITITVPKSELLKHKRYFQRAANDVDKTAKTVSETENSNGTTSVKYILKKREDRSKRAPRKGTEAAQTEGTENTQTEGAAEPQEDATVEVDRAPSK